MKTIIKAISICFVLIHASNLKAVQLYTPEVTIVDAANAQEQAALESLKWVADQLSFEHKTSLNFRINRTDSEPYLISDKKDHGYLIEISWSALLHWNADQLAYLLMLGIAGFPDLNDISAHSDLLRRFALHTPFNPMAIAAFYEELDQIITARLSYFNLREQTAKDQGVEVYGSRKASIEQVRGHRELVKSITAQVASKEKDLSARLDDFTELPIPNELKWLKPWAKINFWHYHFGPDYQKYLSKFPSSHNLAAVALLTAKVIVSTIGAGAFVWYGGGYVANAATNLIAPRLPTYAGLEYAARGIKIVGPWLIPVAGSITVVSLRQWFAETWDSFNFPNALRADYRSLEAALSKISLIKTMTEQDFHSWLQTLSKHDMTTALARRWLGPVLLSAYEELLNKASMVGLRIGPNTVFNLPEEHFEIMGYPIFSRQAKLLDSSSLDEQTLLKIVRRSNDFTAFSLKSVVLVDSENYPPQVLQEVIKDEKLIKRFQEKFRSLLATKCHLFFVDGTSNSALGRYLLPWPRFDAKEKLAPCLGENIAKNKSLIQAFRHLAFIKDHFYSDHELIRKAVVKAQSIVDRYSNLQDLLAELDLAHTDFESSFHVRTILGEAIATRPTLITSLKDIEAMLSRDIFWPYDGSKERNSKQVASAVLDDLHKASLGYNIELVETLHGLLLKRIRDLSINLSTHDKFVLWGKFVKRGTSIHSDELFWEIYNDSDSGSRLKTTLRELIIQGKLHNQEKKKRVLESQLDKLSDSALPDPKERREFLEAFVEISHRALGRSLAHAELVEEVSQRIMTSREEAYYLEEKKYDVAMPDRDTQDDGIDLLWAIVKEVGSWDKSRQWNLILYVVSHEDKLDESSKTFLLRLSLTPLRLREMFVAMPSNYKDRFIDALLNQKGGILETVELGEWWTDKVLEHLLSMLKPGARQIVRELIGAYLNAANTDGLKYFRSTLFAHLLVSSQKGTDNVAVLAEVCKHFGAFGIKIGQFLAATGVLPEEEASALTDLQDRARSMTRYQIFRDLDEIFKDQEMPYEVFELIGGASLKYVVKARRRDGNLVVLKVLSKDAIAHTKLEEKLLKRMAKYLVDNYGQKYGVFQTAVYAAAEAIDRELDMAKEVERSRLAREFMYLGCPSDTPVHLVEERLIHPRLIEAQFARGGNILRLHESEAQPLASSIVACERNNLFPEDGSNVLFFDPDRHAGNYRVSTKDGIYPIDFGQLHQLSLEERDLVIDFAAIAGILTEAGKHPHAAVMTIAAPFAEWILMKLNTSARSVEGLSDELARVYCSFNGETGLTPYYRLVSLLQTQGLLNDQKQRIILHDLPKGLIQVSRLGQLAKAHNQGQETLEEIFAARVKTRAMELWAELGHVPGYYESFLFGFGIVSYSSVKSSNK